LVGKTWRKILGMCKCRWEDYIKTYPKELK
jgi:hypothetical protein